MSKEQKRDKNGRFTGKTAKKVEVELNVERPKEMSKDEYIKQLEAESEAYKITSERFMGSYLTACSEINQLKAEIAEIEPYKRHFDRLLDVAKNWKKRALAEQDKHLYVLDALREAYMQLGWYQNQLSWWTKKKHREKILNMDMHLDKMVSHAERLDEE